MHSNNSTCYHPPRCVQLTRKHACGSDPRGRLERADGANTVEVDLNRSSRPDRGGQSIERRQVSRSEFEGPTSDTAPLLCLSISCVCLPPRCCHARRECHFLPAVALASLHVTRINQLAHWTSHSFITRVNHAAGQAPASQPASQLTLSTLSCKWSAAVAGTCQRRSVALCSGDWHTLARRR